MIEEKTSEKNKKNIGVKTIVLRVLLVLCFLGFVGIRGVSLLPGWGNIVDTYGFYSAAVLEQEQMAARLSSGISYAYTESLVDLMLVMGNTKWFVAVYHILLQILTFVLLMFGCNMLFGKIAAYASGICMMLSPWVFSSIFLVSPENYYLFFWTVVFCLIGVYFRKGRKSGWYRNNTGEGFLLLLGFLTGILCIWHYFSLTLVLLIFYAMFRNASYVRERVKTQQHLLEMEMLAEETSDSEEDADEPMSNYTQMMIISAGIFLGGYCTLMKYTGITGNFIGAQFKWWLSKLTLFDAYGRWQDIAVWLFIQVAVVIVIGMVQVAVVTSKEKSELQENEAKDSEVVIAEENAMQKAIEAETEKEPGQEVKEVFREEKEAQNVDKDEADEDDWRFDDVLTDDNWRFDHIPEEKAVTNTELKDKVTSVKKSDKKEEKKMDDPGKHKWAALEFDTEESKISMEQEMPKKVELLENPLPLPKKHVKKVMDFDDKAVKDDFDYALRADDDFDV